MGTSEELEDHTGGDNWCNTQFHQSSSVTSHHHTQPVYWIRAVGRHDTIQWHLAHDQKYQEGQAGPHQLLVEGDLRLGLLNLREDRREGLDEIEKSDCRTEHSISLLSLELASS